MRLPIELVIKNDFFVGLASKEIPMSEKIEIDRGDFEWLVNYTEENMVDTILEGWGYPTQENCDRIKKLASFIDKTVSEIIETREQNNAKIEKYREEQRLKSK